MMNERLIGRNSHTLELEELGGFLSTLAFNFIYARREAPAASPSARSHVSFISSYSNLCKNITV